MTVIFNYYYCSQTVIVTQLTIAKTYPTEVNFIVIIRILFLVLLTFCFFLQKIILQSFNQRRITKLLSNNTNKYN